MPNVMLEVTRRPEVDGQQLELRYFREVEVDEAGALVREVARWPRALRLLPAGEWVTDPVMVEAVSYALFERDGLAALVWPVLTAILPPPLENGEVVVGLRRLDVGGALVIGIGSGVLTEEEIESYGTQVSTALLAEFPDEIAQGKLAVVWEAPQ